MRSTRVGRRSHGQADAWCSCQHRSRSWTYVCRFGYVHAHPSWSADEGYACPCISADRQAAGGRTGPLTKAGVEHLSCVLPSMPKVGLVQVLKPVCASVQPANGDSKRRDRQIGTNTEWHKAGTPTLGSSVSEAPQAHMASTLTTRAPMGGAKQCDGARAPGNLTCRTSRVYRNGTSSTSERIQGLGRPYLRRVRIVAHFCGMGLELAVLVRLRLSPEPREEILPM